MPVTIGNTKVYSTKEVQKATLYSRTTVQNLFKDGTIKAQQTPQGAYQVEHENLIDYLVNQQNTPRKLASQIIEYRLRNSNLASGQSTN